MPAGNGDDQQFILVVVTQAAPIADYAAMVGNKVLEAK
jgi:hypothetical protein